MININAFFVDESGSMTKRGLKYINNQYFIICMILTNDELKLKRVFKRFISSNMKLIRNSDKHHIMFYKDGRFKELKGASLNIDLKRKFINYFCQNNLFSIYYICLSNNRAEDYFYSSTARAFNYLIRLSIEHNTINKNINKDVNYFYIDERNVATNTIATLGEYLNIELVTGKHIQNRFIVEYCKSESKLLVQLADVFSNIYYSYIVKGNILDKDIDSMRKNKYIKNEFYFPFSIDKK